MRAGALSLMLLASVAFGQVAGVCGPGKTCKVRNLVTTGNPGVTLASDARACFTGATTTAACTVFIDYNSAGDALRLARGATALQVLPSVVQIDPYATSVQGYGSGTTGTGVAFASFPAVAASVGRVLFDSTNHALRVNTNGTFWWRIPIGYIEHANAYFPGLVALLNVGLTQFDLVNYLGETTTGWVSQSLTATVLVPGTGAGTAVFAIYNVTDAANNATVTMSCAGVAGTSTTGSTYNLTDFPKTVELRLVTNGCATLPQVNLNAQFKWVGAT